MGAILKSKLLRWVLAPIALLWALGWGYIQYQYPTCTFRYKLTAEVMTPDGLKTGSSVVEVSYSHNGDWGGGESANLDITGEATYVDLGAGRNLFVLLTNRASGRNDPIGDTSRNFDRATGALDAFALPIKIFGLAWRFGQEPQLCEDFAAASVNNKPEIPFGSLPTLATFQNLKDPNSVTVVQPQRFEADIGTGYKFLDAKIETTNEEPQNNIETVLPWLPDIKPKGSSITLVNSGPLIDQLHYIGFKTNNQFRP